MEKNFNRLFWLGTGLVSLLGLNVLRKVLGQTRKRQAGSRGLAHQESPSEGQERRKQSMQLEIRDMVEERLESVDQDSSRSKPGASKPRSGHQEVPKNSVYTICFTGGPCAGMSNSSRQNNGDIQLRGEAERTRLAGNLRA